MPPITAKLSGGDMRADLGFGWSGWLRWAAMYPPFSALRRLLV